MEDLRHDKVSFNAGLATEELGLRIAEANQRDVIRRALERELESGDGQSRRLALGLLESFALVPHENGDEFRPSELMLDRFIQSSGSWRSRFSIEEIPYDLNNEKTFAFARAFAQRLRLRIEERFDVSNSGRERLLYSCILAELGCFNRTEVVANVLISNLADNSTYNDALLALQALAAMGQSAEPMLREALPNCDEQAHACIRYLMSIRRHETSNAQAAGDQSLLPFLTWRTSDPLREWSLTAGGEYLRGYTRSVPKR